MGVPPSTGPPAAKEPPTSPISEHYPVNAIPVRTAADPDSSALRERSTWSAHAGTGLNGSPSSLATGWSAQVAVVRAVDRLSIEWVGGARLRPAVELNGVPPET